MLLCRMNLIKVINRTHKADGSGESGDSMYMTKDEAKTIYVTATGPAITKGDTNDRNRN